MFATLKCHCYVLLTFLIVEDGLRLLYIFWIRIRFIEMTTDLIHMLDYYILAQDASDATWKLSKKKNYIKCYSVYTKTTRLLETTICCSLFFSKNDYLNRSYKCLKWEMCSSSHPKKTNKKTATKKNHHRNMSGLEPAFQAQQKSTSWDASMSDYKFYSGCLPRKNSKTCFSNKQGRYFLRHSGCCKKNMKKKKEKSKSMRVGVTGTENLPQTRGKCCSANTGRSFTYFERNISQAHFLNIKAVLNGQLRKRQDKTYDRLRQFSLFHFFFFASLSFFFLSLSRFSSAFISLSLNLSLSRHDDDANYPFTVKLFRTCRRLRSVASAAATNTRRRRQRPGLRLQQITSGDDRRAKLLPHAHPFPLLSPR